LPCFASSRSAETEHRGSRLPGNAKNKDLTLSRHCPVLFLLIPSLMISGVFWPLETTPATILPLSCISPLTYANAGLRKVMLAGGGFGEIGFELVVLAGFAAVMLLLSVLSMRRQAYTA